jgi:site-specific recombinase XerC
MADTPESGSLFDSREVWEADPLEAIGGLLNSSDYILTGKPRAYPGGAAPSETPTASKLSDGSKVVYKAMLGKFLAAMSDQGCQSLFAVSEPNIDLFFEGLAKADAKRETVNRYRRLLERVFDYLVSRDFIEVNPVTQWLKVYKESHQNKKPEDKSPESKPDIVDQETVHRLRRWLRDVGQAAHNADDWRTLRNVVAAMLGVGAGLRAKELQMLVRGQFTIRPGAADGEKVEIFVPPGRTVRTAQEHRVMADSLSEDLLMTWYDLRFAIGIRPTLSANPVVPPGQRVFVGVGREQGKAATPSKARKAKSAKIRDPDAANELSVSYFNRALKELAKRAIDEGIIGEADKWLLCRGAQGLRRAYALGEIQAEAKPQDLRLKLGLHLEESVRRIGSQLKARVRAPRIKA